MSRVTRLLDLVTAALVVACGAAGVLALGGISRILRRHGPRRIVYLGTGQIAQVFPRNGTNLFLERECSDFGGYFEQMWNVHFPAGGRGRLDLTPRHHLVDVDFCPPWQRAAGSMQLADSAWREIRFLL